MRKALLLLALLASAGCSSLSNTEFDAQDLSVTRLACRADLQAEVDALMRPLVVTGYTPGLMVGVLLPDKQTQYFGYGVRDTQSGAVPDEDTLFAIGSLSKGFLAALTSQLVDEGVLSWEATLQDLLPPMTPLSPDARKITLLQLATHTSGLPRQPVTFQTLRSFVAYLFTGESFYASFDESYMLTYLAQFSTDSQGQRQYSNIGYGLLGRIIEQKTGRSLDDLLDERLVRPLGLRCTGYAPETLGCYATRARGYAGDQPKFIRRGNPTPDWTFTPLMRGSAALWSTAKDLLVFASAHMNDQQNSLNQSLARNLVVRFPESKESAAIAWVFDEMGGVPVTYQIGIVAGYTSYLGLDARHKTAVVVLQNSFNWDNSVGHKLLLRLTACFPE